MGDNNKNSDKGNKADWKQWIPVVVAVGPVLGYGLAYVYELGYFNFYKIPTDFIVLGWTTVLVAVATSLSALSFVIWFAVMMAITKPIKLNAVGGKIVYAFIVFIFLLFMALRYLTMEETEQVGIIFVVFVAALFLVPWFIQIMEKISVKRSEKRAVSSEEEAMINNIRKVTGSKYFKYGFVILSVLVLLFSFPILMEGRSA